MKRFTQFAAVAVVVGLTFLAGQGTAQASPGKGATGSSKAAKRSTTRPQEKQRRDHEQYRRYRYDCSPGWSWCPPRGVECLPAEDDCADCTEAGAPTCREESCTGDCVCYPVRTYGSRGSYLRHRERMVRHEHNQESQRGTGRSHR